jgi:uncharacterized protein (UPF0335 family)
MLVSSVFLVWGGARQLLALSNKVKKDKQLDSEKELKMKEIKSDPIKQITYEIDEYFKSDETIDQIKHSVLDISKSLPSIKRQYDNVRLLVGGRFEEGSLSYRKFIAPVESLYQNMTSAILGLIRKLKLFDESECMRKIVKYRNTGDEDRAREQEAILRNYINYIADVQGRMDEISIGFDKLILEVGKLSDEELNKSMLVLKELDDVITNTKLYQE